MHKAKLFVKITTSKINLWKVLEKYRYVTVPVRRQWVMKSCGPYPKPKLAENRLNWLLVFSKDLKLRWEVLCAVLQEQWARFKYCIWLMFTMLYSSMIHTLCVGSTQSLTTTLLYLSYGSLVPNQNFSELNWKTRSISQTNVCSCACPGSEL